MRLLSRLRPARQRAVLAASLIALAPSASAQSGPGDLLVAPTRVVFEGRERNAEITLVNTGAATATYRISFVQMRMTPEGGIDELDPADAIPGELFADSYIRFSPRQVTLEPKVAQTVRLQVRKPATLEPGEYRSHLLFRAVPTDDTALAPDPAAGSAVGVELRAIYGVSVPIIVRHGETSATAEIRDLAFHPAAGEDPANVSLRLLRSGNASVYGDFTVSYLPPSGKPLIVGRVYGVAVYAPNPERRLAIALQLPPELAQRGGRLRVTLQAASPASGEIASGDLPLP